MTDLTKRVRKALYAGPKWYIADDVAALFARALDAALGEFAVNGSVYTPRVFARADAIDAALAALKEDA